MSSSLAELESENGNIDLHAVESELSFDSLLEDLKSACAAGQLFPVQQLMKQLQKAPRLNSSRSSSRRMVPLQPALHAATESCHPEIISFLLSKGLRCDVNIFSMAIKAKSTSCLQVFVDHGWKINRHLGASMAPPLS